MSCPQLNFSSATDVPDVSDVGDVACCLLSAKAQLSQATDVPDVSDVTDVACYLRCNCVRAECLTVPARIQLETSF